MAGQAGWRRGFPFVDAFILGCEEVSKKLDKVEANERQRLAIYKEIEKIIERPEGAVVLGNILARAFPRSIDPGDANSSAFQVHKLKVHLAPFQAMADGLKPFEWRRDDRAFREGDLLDLGEWDPKTEKYTGRSMKAQITYILRGRFNVPKGYCVMGILICEMRTKNGNDFQ